MSVEESQLLVRSLEPGDLAQVEALFAAIANDPAARRFHPHPFDAGEAARVCNHPGEDLYCGAFHAGQLLGYGMLRGWDEGYDVPALGIYLHRMARGCGMGRSFMTALHGFARQKGARQIMLKVYPDNEAALALYRRLGYAFDSERAGQLVGHLNL